MPRADKLTSLKSGSLILLEPSGPVQACTGIALPCALHVRMRMEAIYLSKLRQSSARIHAITPQKIGTLGTLVGDAALLVSGS